jgi:hypothetical protein
MKLNLKISTNLSKEKINGEFISLLIDIISQFLNKPRGTFDLEFISGLN